MDVRDNPGGEATNILAVAGRLADRDRTYGFMRFRDGPRRFTGPVVVLTNRRSVSSGEILALALRVRPNVTIVGDSTAGGGAGQLTRELPNGWTYRFSFASMHALDHTTFEGVGLAPDVWVRGSAEELAAGRDAALDTALEVARRSALTSATPRTAHRAPLTP